MMTQDQSHFEAQQMSQDEDDDDHDSSHSEGATGKASFTQMIVQ